MKKLIVAILVSLSVAAFAEDFSWADFEILVEKAYGKSVYEVYGDNAEAAYEYYAKNPQCFFVEDEDILVLEN